MITGGLDAGGTDPQLRNTYAYECMDVTAWPKEDDTPNWKKQTIRFYHEDKRKVVDPHCDPFVTSLTIDSYTVDMVFIDTGNRPDIMYAYAFEAMGFQYRNLAPNNGKIY